MKPEGSMLCSYEHKPLSVVSQINPIHTHTHTHAISYPSYTHASEVDFKLKTVFVFPISTVTNIDCQLLKTFQAVAVLFDKANILYPSYPHFPWWVFQIRPLTKTVTRTATKVTQVPFLWNLSRSVKLTHQAVLELFLHVPFSPSWCGTIGRSSFALSFLFRHINVQVESSRCKAPVCHTVCVLPKECRMRSNPGLPKTSLERPQFQVTRAAL
jgi:hypothetical protein